MHQMNETRRENTMDKPLRNEKGQFEKGHKPMTRYSYEFAKHFPKIYCNTCWKGSSCPKYHKGYVCDNNWKFRRFGGIRDIDEIIKYLSVEFDLLNIRYYKGCVQEILDGGKVKDRVTKNGAKLIRCGFLLCDLLNQKERSKYVTSPLGYIYMRTYIGMRKKSV